MICQVFEKGAANHSTKCEPALSEEGGRGLEPSCGDSVNCPVFSKSGPSLYFLFLDSNLWDSRGQVDPFPRLRGALF